MFQGNPYYLFKNTLVKFVTQMSFLSRTNEGKPDSGGIDLIQGFNETLRWVYIDEHFRRLQGHRINAVNYRNVQTNIKCLVVTLRTSLLLQNYLQNR